MKYHYILQRQHINRQEDLEDYYHLMLKLLFEFHFLLYLLYHYLNYFLQSKNFHYILLKHLRDYYHHNHQKLNQQFVFLLHLKHFYLCLSLLIQSMNFHHTLLFLQILQEKLLVRILQNLNLCLWCLIS